MMRNRKTLEEQLAEARARKEQAAAKLDQLETRRKARDARLRSWGGKVLVGVVLDAAASQTQMKTVLEGLVAKAELKPKEREAALWLLGSVEPPAVPASSGAPALKNGGQGG
jgi:hypothetical protein